MTASLFSETKFTTFEIEVSTSPPVKLYGHRSNDQAGANKPPLVLLHGYPNTHTLWHPCAETLSEHFNLVMPDNRGYGKSSKPSNKENPDDHTFYAKKTLASDISSLMHALGHKQYYVCGHDRGARITHSLCVNYPQDVKKAIMMDIIPTLAMYDATDKGHATSYFHWFFLIQKAPFPEDMITAAPRIWGERNLNTALGKSSRSAKEIYHPDAYEEYIDMCSDYDAVHAMCEDYRAGANEDMEAQQEDINKGRKIQSPIRLLWGEESASVSRFDVVKEFQKVSEEGCVDVASSMALKCGHFVPAEVPDDVTRHCLEFFQE